MRKYPPFITSTLPATTLEINNHKIAYHARGFPFLKLVAATKMTKAVREIVERAFNLAK